MKLHVTHLRKNHYLEVDYSVVEKKRINDTFEIPRSEDHPFTTLKIRGAIGVDGTPIRADYFGNVPKRLPYPKIKKRFRPNRIDNQIVVINCISGEKSNNKDGRS